MPGPVRKPDPKQNEIAEALRSAEENLTPEQIRIRQLEDSLAKAEAALMDKEDAKQPDVGINPTPTVVHTFGDDGPSKEGNVLIHFVTDGFTDHEVNYKTGDEVEFEPNSPRWREWCTLTEGQQLDRYGKIFFRQGPWQGVSKMNAQLALLKQIADRQDIHLPDAKEVLRAENAERARRRQAPAVTPGY